MPPADHTWASRESARLAWHERSCNTNVPLLYGAVAECSCMLAERREAIRLYLPGDVVPVPWTEAA